MIATIALMLLAAPQADPLVKPRDAYAACLRGLVKGNLEKKTSVNDFTAEMKSKCATQETAFRDAITLVDAGMSAKDIKTDADEQVQDYLDKFHDTYSDYLANGDSPA